MSPLSPRSYDSRARTSSRDRTGGNRPGVLALVAAILFPERPIEHDLVEEESAIERLINVDAATSPATAEWVKNSETSSSPISTGCRLRWKRMNRPIHPHAGCCRAGLGPRRGPDLGVWTC